MFEIFRSVEDVWIIWAISLVILVFCLRNVLKRFNFKNIRRFAASESGASYALPYVLTFPIYLLLMAVLLQASLILMCKIGTMYAAHASARTVTVWQGQGPEDSDNYEWGKAYIRYKAKRSATMAMTPFANSYVNAREDLFPLYPIVLKENITQEDIEKGAIVDLPDTLANLLTYVDRELYISQYKRLNEDAHDNDSSYTHQIIKNRQSQVSADYIRNKYAFAAAATRVSFPEEPVEWNEDLKVTVKYRMAFHIPGTAKIFNGKRPLWTYLTGDKVYYRDIESSVTLPSEAAQTENGRVGIPHNIFYF